MRNKLLRNKDLHQMFDVFNKRYFRDRLPRETSIRFVKLHQQWARVKSRGNEHKIEINVELKRNLRFAVICLLHEMCHISLSATNAEQHGTKFQNKMKRLARVGAFRNYW